MKKVLGFIILLTCLSNIFAATWHYDTDGCTKVCNYGTDSSQYLYKKKEISKEAGYQLICIYGYCF